MEVARGVDGTPGVGGTYKIWNKGLPQSYRIIKITKSEKGLKLSNDSIL